MINPNHLTQVEESYFEHFRFAFWAGSVLIILGIVSIIHAIFPFIFSRTPDKIYRYFLTRSKERIDRVNTILQQKGLK